MMVAGGNGRARQFFKDRGQSFSDRRSKLTSKTANLYKKHLKREAGSQAARDELNQILAECEGGGQAKDSSSQLSGLDALEQALIRQASLEDGEVPPTVAPTSTAALKPKPITKSVPPVKSLSPPPPNAKEEKAKKEQEVNDAFWGEDEAVPNMTAEMKGSRKPGTRRSTKSLLSSRRVHGRTSSSRKTLLTGKRASTQRVPLRRQQTDPEAYAKSKSVLPSQDRLETPVSTAPQATRATSALDGINTGANNKYGGISSDKVMKATKGSSPDRSVLSGRDIHSQQQAKSDNSEGFEDIAKNFFASFQ